MSGVPFRGVSWSNQSWGNRPCTLTVVPEPRKSLGMQPQEHQNIWTYTFGCKVNLADTAQFEQNLAKKSCNINDTSRSPDTILINTCTVTHAADRQARQLIRKMHRQHPTAKIVVTGCYAEAKTQEVKALAGVTHVLPFNQQYQLPVIAVGDVALSAQGAVFGGASKKTRAFLKVQNGCNAYCSFCILPYVRGRSASLPTSELLEQMRGFTQSNYTEVVLTGTHLGAYGRDLNPRTKFSELVRQLIDSSPELHVRISSLEPTTLTPDVIKLVKEKSQIRPHFHIPLQSGSESVLRRMNRKYTIQNFIDRVTNLASARPEMGLGTDVIVGYPGETDEEFAQTLEVCQNLPFTYLHVFPYSPREGTKSITLKDDVHGSVKKKRVAILRQLSRERKIAFARKFLDQEVKVLVEKSRDEKGLLCGHSPEYLSVKLDGPDRLKEREVSVRLKELEDAGDDMIHVLGEII